ncbi:MAG: hypothetical protein KF877_04225 [Bacteroidetes bacterium]|nr:hypothetical protein [Bacteroidota bacterium]
MKRKITLLFTALLLCGFAQAQVSKEAYDKAVDLLNCKTIELSLQGNENLQKFKQKCPCGEVNNTQINQFLTSVGKLDATIALSNEVESLKKSFKEYWKKDEVVTFLSEGIFADKSKYQKIFAFAEIRKGKPEFDTYKTGLKTDLSAKLEDNAPQQNVEPSTTSVQQSTLEEKVAELEKNQNNQKDDKGLLGGLADYLIIISILLGIVAMILSLRKQISYEEIMPEILKSERLRQLIQDQSGFGRATPSNQSNNSAELRDANNRIRDLESQIEKIKAQLNTSNPGSSYTAQTTQPTYQETKQPEVKTETFFLSTPNSDGSFNESSASSSYKDGATIYRFTKIGSHRAKFQIDEKDASAKLALQYPDKNIDPVCDAVNAFNPKATRITTVEQGEAELQNGKWIVDRNKKAKIKYEN